MRERGVSSNHTSLGIFKQLLNHRVKPGRCGSEGENTHLGTLGLSDFPRVVELFCLIYSYIQKTHLLLFIVYTYT